METCIWTIDENDISSCSNCDMELVWDETGSPEEHGYKFCPGCGAKIEKFEVKKPVWAEDLE